MKDYTTKCHSQSFGGGGTVTVTDSHASFVELKGSRTCIVIRHGNFHYNSTGLVIFMGIGSFRCQSKLSVPVIGTELEGGT